MARGSNSVSSAPSMSDECRVIHLNLVVITIPAFFILLSPHSFSKFTHVSSVLCEGDRDCSNSHHERF